MATATASATAEASASGITRREFLYYIWGASIALFTAEMAGLIIWFALPRFREGEFGGEFPVDRGTVPPVNAAPVNNPDGRFWLVSVDNTQPGLQPGQDLMYPVDEEGPITGVLAIYKVCTHLGCIYAWVDANKRFECPCHGSKYRLDGRRIQAPAPRTLDRFKITAVDAQGNVVAESPTDSRGFFLPLDLPASAVTLRIDTGNRVQGPSQRLICEILNNCP